MQEFATWKLRSGYDSDMGNPASLTQKGCVTQRLKRADVTGAALHNPLFCDSYQFDELGDSASCCRPDLDKEGNVGGQAILSMSKDRKGVRQWFPRRFEREKVVASRFQNAVALQNLWRTSRVQFVGR
jgi:hypothetical protein